MQYARMLVAATAVALFFVSGVAQAGPYTDDLSKCLVRSTTEQQKAVLVE